MQLSPHHLTNCHIAAVLKASRAHWSSVYDGAAPSGSTFAIWGGRGSPADLNPRRLHLRHAVIRWFIWPWPGAGGYIHGRVRPQAVAEGPAWRVWKMSEHGRAGAALHLSGSMCSGSVVGKPVGYIVNVTLATFCRNASLMAPTQYIRSPALSWSIYLSVLSQQLPVIWSSPSGNIISVHLRRWEER